MVEKSPVEPEGRARDDWIRLDPLAASPAEVEVWRIDPTRTDLGRYRALLGPEDDLRAEAIRSPVAREAFVATRGLLRSRLGDLLGSDPASLVFRVGPHGKPTLEAAPRDSRLRFNVSHCSGCGLAAIASGRDVGVDVEIGDDRRGCDAIARRYFSSRENAELGRLDESLRVPAFFRIWTRKEAYVKARGEGIRMGFSTFDVSADAARARLIETRGEPEAAGAWSLVALDPGEGFFGALCYGRAEGRHAGAVEGEDVEPEVRLSETARAEDCGRG